MGKVLKVREVGDPILSKKCYEVNIKNISISKDRQIQLLDDLNNCDQSYKNATADILYRLNIDYLISCGEGKFVPSRINKPIKPISEKLNLAIKEGGINIETQQLVTTLKRIQGEVSDGRNNIADKHYGINILNYGRKEPLSKNTNIHTGINTIEFRAFANPEDYKTCLENIFLVGRLMEVSEELGQIDLKKDRSQEEKRKIELREKLKEDIPSHEKIEYFLDLIFEKDKDIYMDRFVENYKILEKEENKAIKNKIAFHKIDFGERVIEKEDIIR